MRKNRWLLILTALLAVAFAIGSPVSAYQDIDGVPGREKIDQLKKQGIIDGIGKGRFGPNQKLNYAQGIALIVRGLGLNIDHLEFIKPPKASDTFTHVPDNAWYSKYFVIAHYNGLDVPKDVKPNRNMTREEFAHYLFQGLSAKGDYAFIELFVLINDEDQIDPNYMNSIQKLLVSHIAELDSKGNFYPKREITRAEAAVLVYNTIQFIKNVPPIPAEPEEDDVTMSVEKVNEDILKVTLSRGEKPNPGYGIEITKIEFKDNRAVVYYTTSEPDPDRMYPQVVTEPKATAYIDARYEPSIQRDGHVPRVPADDPSDSVSKSIKP